MAYKIFPVKIVIAPLIIHHVNKIDEIKAKVSIHGLAKHSSDEKLSIADLSDNVLPTRAMAS